MKATIRNQWIKALRSGEYAQIIGVLDSGKGYCALGVLCTLALNEGICTYSEEHSIGAYDGRIRSLSFNIMNWAGVDWENDNEKGYLNFDLHGKKTSIAKLNDSGLSFNQIADIIERYLD